MNDQPAAKTCAFCGVWFLLEHDALHSCEGEIKMRDVEIAQLRNLLSRIHETALYENECPWCHEDPVDEHAVFPDEDGDEHPCFGEEIHAAIRGAPRPTSARKDAT